MPEHAASVPGQEPAASGGIPSVPGTGYRRTTRGCFTAYVVQAIVNNFTPLLFVQFVREFSVTLGQLTLLTSLNFLIQLCIDLISVKLIDRIGYRAGMLAAHACAFAGICGLGFIPDLVPGRFGGLMLCMCLYACGGGLLEVLVSPVIDALPSDNKSASMSLLHSFYSWGHAAVIGLSTLFFLLAGVANWRVLAYLWALVPLVNGLMFIKLPLPASLSRISRTEAASDQRRGAVCSLLRSGTFWLFFALMFFAGSSEQAIAQWVSAFAEAGLHVDKATGDLAGALLFAVSMGISRLLFGKIGKKLSLRTYMPISAVCCVLLYAGIVLVPVPIVKLLLSGLCGFSVGIFWPGSVSLGSAALPNVGTPLFALLALAGDLGCMAGPGVVGLVSELAGGRLTAGIAAAAVFPVALVIVLFYLLRPYGKIKGRKAAGEGSGDRAATDGGNTV